MYVSINLRAFVGYPKKSLKYSLNLGIF